MSVITFRPAVRAATTVFIGISGPPGSGKTKSALRLASGIAGDRDIFLIDTESGKALHYASQFRFQHGALAAPFTPARYREAVEAAARLKPGCVIVDSTSHMHEGPGGVLEWHDAELDRLAGNNVGDRDKMSFAAWAKPKHDMNRFVNAVLQLNINVIFCFRARDKLALKPVKKGSKVVHVPTSIGVQPIITSGFDYEMTAMLVLPWKSQGVPDVNAEAAKMIDEIAWIFVPGRQIDEAMGRDIAAWCEGADSPEAVRHQLLAAGGIAAAKGPDGLSAWWRNLDQVAKRTVGTQGRDSLAKLATAAASGPVAEEAGSPDTIADASHPSNDPGPTPAAAMSTDQADPTSASADLSGHQASSSGAADATPGELPLDLGGAEAEGPPSEWVLWAQDAISHLNALRSVGDIETWRAGHAGYFGQLQVAEPAWAERVRLAIEDARRRLSRQRG